MSNKKPDAPRQTSIGITTEAALRLKRIAARVNKARTEMGLEPLTQYEIVSEAANLWVSTVESQKS